MIVDDDFGMRIVLKKAIEKVEGFEFIGEAEDGEVAFHFAQAFHPDVVFIDVEMPKINGVECAKKIMDMNPNVFIIFATAHDEYMPEAFELYAFDYLVKPFKIDRVFKTLDRIKQLSANKNTVKPQNINKLDNLGKLIIRGKDSTNFIDIKDIILIQREERSSAIYTAEDRYVTSESLSDIEKRLDSNLFLRSHKSYIINLSMINKIQPYGRWTYIVTFKDFDKDALLTHDKYEELQSRFS